VAQAAPRGDSYPASFVSTNRIRVVTDSACDLPQPVADELGIEIVPLTIRIDGKEYVDRRDLSVAEFWAKCAASPTLPETAAPSPGQFEEVYRHLHGDGATGIVTVSLSGALSDTMQSAELAARAVADTIPVTVVDSRSATVGLGAIVVGAARHAAEGGSRDDVAAQARQLADRTRVWGALDTLDNLKKGGRIGGAKALLASALAIKPIVEVRDGKVEQGGKQRTRAKALAFLVDKVAEVDGLDELYVLQADCHDVDQFVEMLRPHVNGRIIVGDIGPVVGSHTGRGTIGVAFFATR
jgi:DegV family protein with EDD domain